MKRITAIAITVAAVLGCSYVGTASAAQGKVENTAVVCGDHYLLIQAVDQTIAGSMIDNRKAVFTTIEHGAKKGAPFANILIVTSSTPDGKPGVGFVLHMTPTTQYLQDAAFELDQTSPTSLSYTVSGAKTPCKGA